ncbi:hypothetical protein CBR_g30262 [Chara braunii]|uniref:Protein kinase domain-containing protein n=1 Tax=Chara braunii TaxID=69332 RepID=A0A388LCG8_CHABU|nr:hypothetical protein CBR_g30262 [Chara braunii]|eukprot:GBG80001.1 hypothetical protein CBR_g30262 [Chara braunii]
MGLVFVYVLTFVFLSMTDLVSGELRGLEGGGGGGGGGGREHVGSGHGKLVDAAFACTVEGSSLCQSNQVVLFRGSQWTTTDLDLETLPPLAPLPPRAGTEKSGSASPRAEMLPLGQFSEGVWTEISCNWSLPEPFSKRINAAMNCPAVNGEEALGWGPLACRSSHAFFFSDGVYVQFDLAEGRVVSGPAEIRARFKMPYPFSLGPDAAYPCPVPPLPSTTWTSQLGPQRSFPNCTSESQVIFAKGHMYLVYDLASNMVVVPPHRSPKGFLTWPTEGHSEKIDALVAPPMPLVLSHNLRNLHNLHNQHTYPRALMFLRNGQILPLMDASRRSSHPDHQRDRLGVVPGVTRVDPPKLLQAVHHLDEDTSVKVGYRSGQQPGFFTIAAARRWFNWDRSQRLVHGRRLKATISSPSVGNDDAEEHDVHATTQHHRSLGVRDVGALAGGIVSIITIAVCVIMVCRICWKKRHHDGKGNKSLNRGSSFLTRRLISISAAVSGSFTTASGSSSSGGLCRDLEFDYGSVAAATNGFNAANIIGTGSNGSVYKGRLNGRHVAIKKLAKTAGTVGKGFYAEVEALGRARHPNLVDFMGFVADGTHDVMLVFGYLPNGSLFDHLHDRASRANHLTWERRMGIARGIAEGLCHLHTDLGEPLAHEDVKPSNVLLEKNFSPRLVDFGLNRLRGAVVVGSGAASSPAAVPPIKNQGYADPFACENTQQTSSQSDVYAYGVLLLELISGRRPMDVGLMGPDGCRGLIAWSRPLIRDGLVEEVVDKRLRGKFAHHEAQNLSLLAVACIEPNPEMRPDMAHVVVAVMALMEGKPWEAILPGLLSKSLLAGGCGDEQCPTGQCGRLMATGECQSRHATWDDSYMFNTGHNLWLQTRHCSANSGCVRNSAYAGIEAGYGSCEGGEQHAATPCVAQARSPYECSRLAKGAMGVAIGSGYVATRGWVGTFRNSPCALDPAFSACDGSVKRLNGPVRAVGSEYCSCDGGGQHVIPPRVVQAEEPEDGLLREGGRVTVLGSPYVAPRGRFGTDRGCRGEPELGYTPYAEGCVDQRGGLSPAQFVGMEYLGCVNTTQLAELGDHGYGLSSELGDHGYGLSSPLPVHGSPVGSAFSCSPGYSTDNARCNLSLRTGSDFSCATEVWVSGPTGGVDTRHHTGSRAADMGSPAGHNPSGPSCGSSGPLAGGEKLSIRSQIKEGAMAYKEWDWEGPQDRRDRAVLSPVGNCGKIAEVDTAPMGLEQNSGPSGPDGASKDQIPTECLQQVGMNCAVGMKGEIAIPMDECEGHTRIKQEEKARGTACTIELVDDGRQHSERRMETSVVVK